MMMRCTPGKEAQLISRGMAYSFTPLLLKLVMMTEIEPIAIPVLSRRFPIALERNDQIEYGMQNTSHQQEEIKQ
jgi:hypothetical protein